MRKTVFALLSLPLLAGGCLSTVGTIVTAPVKVVSKGVDWTTTSQEESDRNYGKKMRKQEAQEGHERKKAMKACRDRGGSDADCAQYDGYRAGYSQRADDYERP